MKVSFVSLLPLLAVIFAASDAVLAVYPPAGLGARALPAAPSRFQHIRRAAAPADFGGNDLVRRRPLLGSITQVLDDSASSETGEGGLGSSSSSSGASSGASSSSPSDSTSSSSSTHSGEEGNATAKPLPTGSVSDSNDSSNTPSTSSGSGSSSTSGSSSSSGGGGGGLLGGLGDALANTVGTVGDTVNTAASNVGKTVENTTGGLGKTAGNLTHNLDKTLGTGGSSSPSSSGSDSKSSSDSGSSSSSDSATSKPSASPSSTPPSGNRESSGGLLGGLGDALGGVASGLGDTVGDVLGAPEPKSTAPTTTSTSTKGDSTDSGSTGTSGSGSSGSGTSTASSGGGGLLGGLGDTLGGLTKDLGDTVGGVTKGPEPSSPTGAPATGSGSSSTAGKSEDNAPAASGATPSSSSNGGLLGGLGDTLGGVTSELLGGGSASSSSSKNSGASESMTSDESDPSPTITKGEPTQSKQSGLLDPIITPITSLLGGGGGNPAENDSTDTPVSTTKGGDQIDTTPPKTATNTSGTGDDDNDNDGTGTKTPTETAEPTRTIDYTSSSDDEGAGTGVGPTSTVTPTLDTNTLSGGINTHSGGEETAPSDSSPTPTPPTSTGSDQYWYADSSGLILPMATEALTLVQGTVDPAATTTAAVPSDPIARYPASIVPPGATSEQPDGTALVSILFKPTVPWIGLVQTPATATQLFAYMPLLLSETSGITTGDVTVVRLTSYYKNSERDINKALSMYQAYIPIAAAQILQEQVRDTSSVFYTVPSTAVAKQIAANIDPTYDILATPNIRTSVNGGGQQQTSFNGDDKATLRNALIGVGSAFVAVIVAFIGWRVYRHQQKSKKAAMLRASRSGGVGAQTIRSFGPAASLRETWAPSVHEQHAAMHGQQQQQQQQTTWENEIQNSGPYIDAGYGQPAPAPHHLDGLDQGNFGDPFGDAFVAPTNRASRETQRTEAGVPMSSARSRTSQLTEAQRIQYDYLESRSVRASMAGVVAPISPGSASSHSGAAPAGMYQDAYGTPQQYTSSHAYGPRSIDNRRKRSSRASISTSSIGRPEMQSNSMLF